VVLSTILASDLLERRHQHLQAPEHLWACPNRCSDRGGAQARVERDGSGSDSSGMRTSARRTRPSVLCHFPSSRSGHRVTFAPS
jgi:hypothetical protein